MIKKWIRFLLVPLFLFASTPLFALNGDDQELLEPDLAFALSTRVIDGNTIEASWKVADGYYLYRDKFKLSVTQGKASIGDIKFPKGKIKKDPTFGDTEVYYKKVVLRVPLVRQSAGKESVAIRIDYQGCNEPIGVCYPPVNKEISFKLPAGTAATRPKPVDSLKSLNNLLQGSGGQQEFLPVDKAFPVSADTGTGNSIDVILGVSRGYYLYRDKIQFKLLAADGSPAAGVALGAYKLPQGKMKKDPTFGDTEVYYDAVSVNLALSVNNKALTAASLRVDYQGCAIDGICYPPNSNTYALKLDNGKLVSVSLVASGFLPPAGDATPAPIVPADADDLTEEEKLARLFAEGNVFVIVISLLGFGILLAFTACMYPMIPILSSIITGHGEHVTPMKGFILSVVYVGSMAVTFGVIGAIVGFFGQQIGVQAYFQNPWIIGFFAALFVALALSMFGFYDIQVPASIQGRLSQFSSQQKGGTFIGVAVIGVLSALIIGPCGGPVLLGTLAGAASSGSWALGFLYMFVLALGMGLPLLVVGAGGGTLLPKAGAWMSTVKSVGGVVLLAVAIYFLERILPAGVYMMLWAALFIVSGIFLGAFDSLTPGVSGWRRLWKGLGLILILYGIVVMVGGLTGARNFNDPLHGSSLIGVGSGSAPATVDGPQPAYIKSAAGKPSVIKGGLTFIRIKSWDDFRREVKSANANGYTVMMDFYADWCTYCKQFDDYVFSEPKVQSALSNTVLLQADVTALDDADKLLMKNLKVTVPPAILFYKTDGIESRRQRVIGFMKADKFLQRIRQAFAA